MVNLEKWLQVQRLPGPLYQLRRSPEDLQRKLQQQERAAERQEALSLQETSAGETKCAQKSPAQHKGSIWKLGSRKGNQLMESSKKFIIPIISDTF
jgi:hypothetical protein